jgi:cytochrome c biogenesis protein CcmG, thiol:disulfide interchange protein DsbE
MMKFIVPLAIFIVLVIVLAVGLKLDPRYVPSPLIDKPAPEFSLSSLDAPETTFTKQNFLGRPIILNVWASWCVACRDEHPLLVELAQDPALEIIGLNYKDARDDARAWLVQRGNPYRHTIFDPQGSLGLNLGVYGVPETFVIDAQGVIRHKRVGVLTPEIWRADFVPLLSRLRSAPAKP